MLVVRGLGATDPTNPDNLSVRPHPVSPPIFDAATLVAGGILGATVLVLHGSGYTREAFALGATAALVGGTLAAIRLLTGHQT